jgi:tetratricopeptide (TPR) repeat protein
VASQTPKVGVLSNTPTSTQGPPVHTSKTFVTLRLAALLLSLAGTTTVVSAQEATRPPIPGQLAQDFVAGRVPRESEVAEAEKDAAANPNSLAPVRRLAKAYFFQFFGGNKLEAFPKAQATFDRAFAIAKDDPESLAYSGALLIFHAGRVEKDEAAKKASYDKGFAMLQKAQQLAPRNGAVTSVAAGSYVDLPASYGMAPVVIQMVEGMRRGMGPAWEQFSHHGRQRLLLTLGRAYALDGKADKARANFDEALKINETSTEARLIKAEQAKLPTP